jgi:hypothetical protein
MPSTNGAVRARDEALADRWKGYETRPVSRTRDQRSAASDEEAFAAVGAVAAQVAARLPGLGLLAPNGMLDLPVDHGRVVAVRLQMPPGLPLQLQSIGLTAEGIPDLAPVTTLTASSWHGTYRERFDLRRLLDIDNPTGPVVRTEADAPPWVELRFARPVRLTRVRLRNIPTATARRAHGLVVSVTTMLRRQHTLYDGATDLRELDRLLGPARVVAAVNPLLASLLPALDHALRCDYRAAVADVAALSDVDVADQRRFREVLNAGLLASREREWAAHGPQRTFRFWSTAERERYLHEAVELVEALRPLSPDVSFGFGSVLAAVRDGALLPHDDVLDLVVAFEHAQTPNLADALRLVTQHLAGLGYLVTGGSSAHRHVSRPGRPGVNIFVGLYEDERISWYPGVRGSLTRSMMFPTSTVDLAGVACPLPARPSEYLRAVYGPGWRVPDPDFTHASDRAAYADISGLPRPTRGRDAA